MPLLCLLHFPSLSSVRFLFSVACVSSFSCFSFSSVRKGFTHREHKTFSVEKKKKPHSEAAMLLISTRGAIFGNLYRESSQDYCHSALDVFTHLDY